MTGNAGHSSRLIEDQHKFLHIFSDGSCVVTLLAILKLHLFQHDDKGEICGFLKKRI